MEKRLTKCSINKMLEIKYIHSRLEAKPSQLVKTCLTSVLLNVTLDLLYIILDLNNKCSAANSNIFPCRQKGISFFQSFVITDTGSKKLLHAFIIIIILMSIINLLLLYKEDVQNK